MELKKRGVYKTKLGNYLRFESKGEVMYNFVLVDEKGNLLPEKRNGFGHVVIRSKQQYSGETIKSFKLIKNE